MDAMNIVVGYEGSRPSLSALKLAVMHAGALQATVLVVNSQPGGDESPKEQIIEARQHLMVAEELLAENGVRFETHLLVRGNMPGEDIVEFARDREADEIIIGVKRRSRIGKMIFGSNAQHVVLHAHCPVVTVR
jgi:nucleotide-binding universal stress UspA family protein